MTRPGPYNKNHIASSIFMLLALAWLTVSLPFVYEEQQLVQQSQHHSNDDVCDNPFAGTTEEKTEGGVNSLSEYLHELNALDHEGHIIVKYFKCYPSDLYFAYHPELISPPPDVTSI